MVALLACAVLIGIDLPRALGRRRVALVLVAVAAIGVSVPIVTRTVNDVIASIRGDSEVDPWRVAQALRDIGLRPGYRVAILGHKDRHAFWARLARARIVAQLPISRLYWPPPPELSPEIRDALSSSGAQIAIARHDALWTATDPAKQTLGPSWRPLGTTGYFVLWLASPSGPTR
jgi:hypothetical protein